jgi:hypothetical protein
MATLDHAYTEIDFKKVSRHRTGYSSVFYHPQNLRGCLGFYEMHNKGAGACYNPRPCNIRTSGLHRRTHQQNHARC